MMNVTSAGPMLSSASVTADSCSDTVSHATVLSISLSEISTGLSGAGEVFQYIQEWTFWFAIRLIKKAD